MTKVNRRIMEQDVFTVECGQATDGTEPAWEILELLRLASWPNKKAKELPDSRQVDDYFRLLDFIDRLASDVEMKPGSYNRLRDGIWELRVRNVRLTFYDTDGAGAFTPKLGEWQDEWDGGYWELPYDFDDFIRLGVYWEKDTDKARPFDINRSIKFREEDIAHDREEEQPEGESTD